MSSGHGAHCYLAPKVEDPCGILGVFSHEALVNLAQPMSARCRNSLELRDLLPGASAQLVQEAESGDVHPTPRALAILDQPIAALLAVTHESSLEGDGSAKGKSELDAVSETDLPLHPSPNVRWRNLDELFMRC